MVSLAILLFLAKCESSMPTGTLPASTEAEIDDAADDLAVEQIGVGIVDVIEPVAPGDHLVELQLTGPIQPRQAGDVRLWVARPEHRADQVLVPQDEVLQVDLGRTCCLRGHSSEYRGATLAGQHQPLVDVVSGDQGRCD